MRCLIFLIVTVVVAVQAKPFYGMGGLGYGSGSDYGGSRYDRGRNGFMNGGYNNNLYRGGHDIGHMQNDFDAYVHRHQYAGHNVGGVLQGNQGGHMMNGYNGYSGGRTGYGNGWNNGFY